MQPRKFAVFLEGHKGAAGLLERPGQVAQFRRVLATQPRFDALPGNLMQPLFFSGSQALIRPDFGNGRRSCRRSQSRRRLPDF